MALATDVYIDNNTSGLRVLLRGCAQFSFKKSQPAISIALIGTQPQNNVLFRFSGQTEEVTFQFKIINDGSDVSAGTNSSTIITIDDQIAYLRNSIYTSSYSDSWNFTQLQFFPTPVAGVITDLTIDAEGGNPNTRTGSITFMRGRIGSL